jgi:hypothetical protein
MRQQQMMQNTDETQNMMREALNVPEGDHFMAVTLRTSATMAPLVLPRVQQPHRRQKGVVQADCGAARRKRGIQPEDVFVNVLDAAKRELVILDSVRGATILHRTMIFCAAI